jgi:hypothetical protein
VIGPVGAGLCLAGAGEVRFGIVGVVPGSVGVLGAVGVLGTVGVVGVVTGGVTGAGVAGCGCGVREEPPPPVGSWLPQTLQPWWWKNPPP